MIIKFHYGKYVMLASVGKSIRVDVNKIKECDKWILFHNSAKRIHPFEIKRVRRITSFSGNELATVPIAVVCIALLVRITLTDAKIQN